MTASVTYIFDRALFLSPDGMVLFPDHRRKTTCISDVTWLPVQIMPVESTSEMIAFLAHGLRESIPVNESVPVHPLDSRLTKILLKCTGSRSDSAFSKKVHGLNVHRNKLGEYLLDFVPAHEKDPSKGWYRVSLGNDGIESLPEQVLRYLNELHEGTINFSTMTRVQ
jgi:hypothetical protein